MVYDSHSRASRKNPEGAILAFRKAFPRGEDVRLVIKVRHPQTGEAGILQALAHHDPRIQIVHEELSERAMVALMATAHALVSLHRSEGFGLHIAEAMAAGLVCIISGCGGCLDFATPDRVRWVAVQEAQVADSYFRNHGGSWWDPDINHAASLMRETWERYGEPVTGAMLKRAAVVAEELSPARMAEQAREYLEPRAT